jgi:hypothetical protein
MIYGRQNSDWSYKQIPDERTLNFFLVHTGVPTIQGPVIIPFLKSHTTFPTQSLNMMASDSSETLPN